MNSDQRSALNEAFNRLLVESGLPNIPEFDLAASIESVDDIQALQAAVVPLQSATDTLAAGPVTGLEISGFTGDATQKVFGATALDTGLATGVNAGTAGAATTATALKKPGAAANWTASDLKGRWLLITGGGGYVAGELTLRPIVANTTDTITLASVPGMDNTTTFQIVTLASSLQVIGGDDVALRILNNQAPIEIVGVNFADDSGDYFVELLDNAKVTFIGCHFDGIPTLDGFSAARNATVALRHCQFSGGAGATVSKGSYLELTDVLCLAGGQIEANAVAAVDVRTLVAADATGNALRLIGVGVATAEVSASDGGATAVYLESVAQFTAVGTLLVGTGNTGYGIEMAGGSGDAEITGCTITGTTGDINFFGNNLSYATLTDPAYGVVKGYGSRATASVAPTKALTYGNYTFVGSIDISGRLLLYGYMNISANLVVPTLTGTQVLDMEAGTIDDVWANFGQIRGMLEVECNSATAVIRLPSGAAIAGVIVVVANTGSQTALIEPPTGGVLNGGANATVAAGTAKKFISLNGNGGKNYYTIS